MGNRYYHLAICMDFSRDTKITLEHLELPRCHFQEKRCYRLAFFLSETNTTSPSFTQNI